MQQQFIDALDNGWQMLHDRLAERVERERERDRQDRVEQLSIWLQRIDRERAAAKLEFEILATEDASRRQALVANVEQLAAKTTEEDALVAQVYRLCELKAPERAYVAAQRVAARFPANAEMQEAIRDLELVFLHQIVAKLRSEQRLIDTLLAEWGGQAINPESGDWKFHPLDQNSYGLAFAAAVQVTRDVWAGGLEKRADAAEQIAGLMFLIRFRQDGTRLRDMPQEGEEIMRRLLPTLVYPVGDPRRQAQGVRLQAAVARAMSNRDVLKLQFGEAPQLDSQLTYLSLQGLDDSAVHRAGMVVGLVMRHLIMPAALGFVGGIVAEVPGVQQMADLYQRFVLGNPAVSWPADFLARYKNYLAELPGAAGAVAPVADAFLRPYLVEQMCVGITDAMAGGDVGAQSYGTLFFSGSLRLWLSLVEQRAATAGDEPSVQRRRMRTASKSVAQRRGLLEIAHEQNEKHADVLKRLTAQVEGRAVPAAVQVAAADEIAEINRELNAFDAAIRPGLIVSGTPSRRPVAAVLAPAVGTQPIIDEKLVQRDALVPLTGNYLPAPGRQHKFDKVLVAMRQARLADLQLARLYSQQFKQPIYSLVQRKETVLKPIRVKKLGEPGALKIGMPDPAFPTLTVERLDVDHIVPARAIVEMEGFDRLSFDNQIEVLNYEPNLEVMSDRANRSRRDSSFKEWEFYDGNIPVNKQFRQTMIQREEALRKELQQLIDELRKKQKVVRLFRPIQGSNTVVVIDLVPAANHRVAAAA